MCKGYANNGHIVFDADIVLYTPHLYQALALLQQGREWLGEAVLNLAAQLTVEVSVSAGGSKVRLEIHEEYLPLHLQVLETCRCQVYGTADEQ